MCVQLGRAIIKSNFLSKVFRETESIISNTIKFKMDTPYFKNNNNNLLKFKKNKIIKTFVTKQQPHIVSSNHCCENKDCFPISCLISCRGRLVSVGSKEYTVYYEAIRLSFVFVFHFLRNHGCDRHRREIYRLCPGWIFARLPAPIIPVSTNI